MSAEWAKSWANFLSNEKLPIEEVASLVMEAAQIRPPRIMMHKDKLESRDFICRLAMSLGIDLTAIKRRGKMAMGRGLLDAWTAAYTREFGSCDGTAAAREQRRRDIKTKLRSQHESLRTVSA